MDSFTTDVAANVRRAISDKGETQLSVSESTGIPRTTLIRRLDGVNPFTVAELRSIATMLGVRVRDLIDVAEDAA